MPPEFNRTPVQDAWRGTVDSFQHADPDSQEHLAFTDYSAWHLSSPFNPHPEPGRHRDMVQARIREGKKDPDYAAAYEKISTTGNHYLAELRGNAPHHRYYTGQKHFAHELRDIQDRKSRK